MVKKVKGKSYPLVVEVVKNNKSRKGTYMKVQLVKGGTVGLYKKKVGLNRQDYLDAKRFGMINKKSGVTKQKQKVEMRKKYKSVEGVLESGYAETKIDEVRKLTPYAIRIMYKKLLLNDAKAGNGKPIVKDNQLIEILTETENVKKYQHRIGYKMQIVGEKGVLAELEYVGGVKSLQKVVSEVRKYMKVGTNIVDYSPKFAKELKSLGYNYSHMNNGKIKSVNMKMVFRKA
jgi:hypothetical protein